MSDQIVWCSSMRSIGRGTRARAPLPASGTAAGAVDNGIAAMAVDGNERESSVFPYSPEHPHVLEIMLDEAKEDVKDDQKMPGVKQEDAVSGPPLAPRKQKLRQISFQQRSHYGWSSENPPAPTG